VLYPIEPWTQNFSSIGVHIVAYELFFSTPNLQFILSIGTARGSALPYLAFHRSASVGRSLAGRPPGGGLLANAMRVRLGRLAAGRVRQPAVASSLQFFYNKKRTVFNNRVRPLAATKIKKIQGRGIAEPLANKA